MAFSLVANTGTNQTSSAVNTTGVNLIVIVLSYPDSTASAPTDNYGNTYTLIAAQKGSSGYGSAIYYCANPTVGSSHTFTNNQTEYGSYVGYSSSICVLAFSGGAASSPLDQYNGGTSGFGYTIQPGSVTPTISNELIVTGLADPGSSSGVSIDSSFTITPDAPQSTDGGYYCRAAYLIQTSATAENPTWTSSYNNPGSFSSTIATFKPGSGSSTPSLIKQLLYGFIPQRFYDFLLDG